MAKIMVNFLLTGGTLYSALTEFSGPLLKKSCTRTSVKDFLDQKIQFSPDLRHENMIFLSKISCAIRQRYFILGSQYM
jgi:hypothetical protein